MQTRKRKAAIVRRRAPKTKVIVRREPEVLIPPHAVQGSRVRELRGDEIELLKRTVAKGTDQDQFALFLWVCRKHHVDPLIGQIYCILYNVAKHHQDDKGIWCAGKQMVIQMGINGYRSLAARNHADFGCCDEAEFVMSKDKTPAGRSIPEKATVRMWKKGLDRPVVATVYWEEFAPANLSESRSDFWNRMPKHMLAKCAESHAIRKGYPDMADIYTNEEMVQHSQDFTPEGRQIVRQDGTAPSGRPVTYEARQRTIELDDNAAHAYIPGSDKARMADEALKRVEAADLQWKAEQEKKKDKESAVDVTPSKKYVEPKPTPPNPNWPTLEAETVNPNEFIIRGDISGKLFPMIEFSCKWDRDWWRCDLESLQKMQALQQREGFNLTILQAAQPAKKEKPATKTSTSGTAGSKPPAGAVSEEVVTGVIQDYWEKMTKGVAPTETSKGRPSVPFLRLLFKKLDKKTIFVSTYDKPSFKALIEAKDRQTECRFRIKIKGDYIDMLEIQKLGKTEYHEGVPVIQRGQQEAGGKTLF